jgi:hypothetical protein
MVVLKIVGYLLLGCLFAGLCSTGGRLHVS